MSLTIKTVNLNQYTSSATLTNAVLAVCEESYAAAYNHSPPDDRAAPGIRDSKSFGGFLF